MLDYNAILDGLLVGTYLRDGRDIDRLHSESRITGVLNLQTDEDMEIYGLDWMRLGQHYGKRKIQVARVPIQDFDPTDLHAKLTQGVDALEALMGRDQRVYVHCTAGVGRSPAVVIAWLAWCRGWDLPEAIAHVKSRRHCAPYVEVIRLATLDRLG
ncbi:MAG: dual specificity protein phosphatase family protein [Acidiferrobacterales bacterium]